MNCPGKNTFPPDPGKQEAVDHNRRFIFFPFCLLSPQKRNALWIVSLKTPEPQDFHQPLLNGWQHCQQSSFPNPLDWKCGSDGSFLSSNFTILQDTNEDVPYCNLPRKHVHDSSSSRHSDSIGLPSPHDSNLYLNRASPGDLILSPLPAFYSCLL